MKQIAMVMAVVLMAAGASAAILPGMWNSGDSDLQTGTWTEIYGPDGPGQPGAELSAESAVDPAGSQWSLGGIYIVTGATVKEETETTITYTTDYYNESDPGASMLMLGDAPTLWGDAVTFTNLSITVDATIDKGTGVYLGGTFTGSASTAAGLMIQISGELSETPEVPVENGHTGTVDYLQITIVPVEVPLDIKPGSCPNPFNARSNGVLPMALLGDEGFDVMTIDPNSIVLVLADDPEAEGIAPLMGPPGPGIVYEDVAAPASEPCACPPMCGDGYMDMLLKFRTQDVAGLGTFEVGTTVELMITGTLMDGTPFVASDCIQVVQVAKMVQVRVQARNAGLGQAVK